MTIPVGQFLWKGGKRLGSSCHARLSFRQDALKLAVEPREMPRGAGDAAHLLGRQVQRHSKRRGHQRR